jgi:FAD/FMN-containing dehydrogenase
LTAADEELRGKLRGLLGDEALLSSPEAVAPYLTDHRHLFQGAALAVARPRTVDQVASLLAFCNTHRIAVVPHGGNTSYCGGATPDGSGRQLVVSMPPMTR